MSLPDSLLSQGDEYVSSNTSTNIDSAVEMEGLGRSGNSISSNYGNFSTSKANSNNNITALDLRGEMLAVTQKSESSGSNFNNNHNSNNHNNNHSNTGNNTSVISKFPSAKEGIARFLMRTFDIFSNPEFEDAGICGWGPNNSTIVVKKIEAFSNEVLPRYFKKGNYKTFVRQLNMYDFHKTVSDPNNGEFVHKYFHRNRRDMLHLIKRKAYQSKLAQHSGGGAPGGDDDEDCDEDVEESPSIAETLTPTSDRMNSNGSTNVTSLKHSSSLQSINSGTSSNHSTTGPPVHQTGAGGGSAYKNTKGNSSSLIEQLRAQRTISDKTLQQISSLENENFRLQDRNLLLRQTLKDSQNHYDQTYMRLDTALRFLYLYEFSHVPHSSLSSEIGKPTGLIRSITTTGAIPAKLLDSESKWMEDYSASIVMSAPQDSNEALQRQPSFDEFVRNPYSISNSNNGMPLMKSHSLFDDRISSDDTNPSYYNSRGFSGHSAAVAATNMLPPHLYTNPKLQKHPSNPNLSISIDALANQTSVSLSPRYGSYGMGSQYKKTDDAVGVSDNSESSEILGLKRPLGGETSNGSGSKSPRSLDLFASIDPQKSAELLLGMTLSRINSVDDSYLSFMHPSSMSSHTSQFYAQPILSMSPRSLSTNSPHGTSISLSSPINDKFIVL